MHALEPLPPPTWTPRVLVCASGSGRLSLMDDLCRQELAVLMASPDGLLQELDRGDVDAVVLATDATSALEQLIELRAITQIPVVVVLRHERVPPQPFFDAGADDCVFARAESDELGDRLRSALTRHGLREPAQRLRGGRFVLDLAQHTFTLDGRPVHLPPKEFGLLALLVERDGRVVGRQEALELVWGAARSGDQTTVDVHVKRLRSKLETDPGRPAHLLTVRGLGYRFQS